MDQRLGLCHHYPNWELTCSSEVVTPPFLEVNCHWGFSWSGPLEPFVTLGYVHGCRPRKATISRHVLCSVLMVGHSGGPCAGPSLGWDWACFAAEEDFWRPGSFQGGEGVSFLFLTALSWDLTPAGVDFPCVCIYAMEVKPGVWSPQGFPERTPTLLPFPPCSFIV